MSVFLERARIAVRTARHLLGYGDPVAAGSRAYYAVFDAMRAVLEHDGISTVRIKTHHGLILSFEQHVVRSGRMARDVANAIQKSAELRWLSDYSAGEPLPAEHVGRTLDPVARFVEACAALVEGETAP